MWANIYTLRDRHQPCFNIISHLDNDIASQLVDYSLLHKLNVSILLCDNSLANKYINLFVSRNYTVSWVLSMNLWAHQLHSSQYHGGISFLGNAICCCFFCFFLSQERRCPWRPPIRSCWSSTPRVASRPEDFTLSTKVTPSSLSSPG